MFYKKRIEALEERVALLELKVARLVESSRNQYDEICTLRSQLESEPKPRSRRRKNNGKEKTTATE